MAQPTFVDLLVERARRHPEQSLYHFLHDGETERGTLTYADADRRARAVAAWLAGCCQPGDRVLLFCPSGLEFMVAFFGCLYAGVAAVPVHTPDPARVRRSLARLRLIVQDAAPSAVLSVAPVLARTDLEACADWGIPPEHWRAVETFSDDAAVDWRRPAIDGSTLAFLQYTSGSTGAPKGVMVQHRNIMANERMISIAMELDQSTVFATWLPLYHDMGIIGPMLQAAYVGGRAAFMSPMAFLQKPFRWLKAVSDYRATTAGGPNFAYDLCAERITDEQKQTLDLSSWRVAFNGAERVRQETADRFAAAFAGCGFDPRALYPCFGMAEATLLVTGVRCLSGTRSQRVSRDELEQHRVREAGPQERASQVVDCGLPRGELCVRIVDPAEARPVADDQVGEIWLSGPSIAAGYWRRPEESAQAFAARLPGDERAWFRTGDLGFMRDGALYVTGRSKEIVIVRGHNYYPQDLEQTVERTHALFRPDGCAAFAVDTDGEERLVVLAEARREWLNKLPMDELVAAVQRNLSADFGLSLHALLIVGPGMLLRTTSGKLQRRLMRRLYERGELEGVAASWAAAAPEAGGPEVAPAAVPSRTVAQIRHWLTAAVARALRRPLERINTAEPLADSGLDSLKLVSLTGELSEWLGRPVAASVVYDHPSIDALARHFAGAEKAAAEGPRVTPAAAAAGAPVAVVGMACRFPGGAGLEAFWGLLNEGRDAVSEVPRERWDWEQFYDPTPGRAGTTNSRWGGFIEDIDRFDALFFGVSPLEAVSMDPQQRLLMMTAWEALEHAGIAPPSLARSAAGVVVGLSSADYGRIVTGDARTIDAFSVTGCTSSVAANRLSFFLDLNGPSVAVDVACASSLAAVQLACQYLRSGASDLMLVGAANALLAPEVTVALSQAGLLSPDGRCQAFDAGANGYVRGEGCGVLVLKRLDDARRDGDRVIGVLREVGLNHNGLSNGLKAPSGRAQHDVILGTLGAAGLTPLDLSYVEAHGTGTLIGDAIELATLRDLFTRPAPHAPLLVGSVKTNVGHLEAVSGMAGLIKVLLMLEHGTIAPHLHVRTPNPSVPLEGSGVCVAGTRTAWPRAAQPRRAGVSSFGFGGVNGFALLEEPPEPPAPEPEAAAAAAQECLLVLSASVPAALEELSERYAGWLERHPEADLGDVCHTAQVGRAHFRHRLALVGATHDELARGLRGLARGAAEGESVRAQALPEPPQIAFLFSGQGTQYENMGWQLYDTQPVFRAAMQRCAAVLEGLLDVPLLDVIHPEGARRGLIHQTRYTQPALFALEYALCCLWRAWGVEPSIVVGHSIGEYVAACVAGVFSLEDGLRLVARRAALMQSLPECGAMAAVFAPEAAVRELAAATGGAEIACVNGPRSCVLSGRSAVVAAAVAEARRRGLHVEPLRVSHAFHSCLVEPILPAFAEAAGEVAYRAPSLPIASNVSGALLDCAPSPDYFVRQARECVRFGDALHAVRAQGATHFLEIGPNATLLGLGQAGLAPGEGDAFTWLASLREGRSELRQMLHSAGALYACGVPLAWAQLRAGRPARRVVLPSYPFQCERYWWERPKLPPAPSVETPVMQALERGDTAALVAAVQGDEALRGFDARQVEALAAAVVSAHAAEGRRRGVRDWLFQTVLRPARSGARRAGRAAAAGLHLVLADRGGVGARLAARLEALGVRSRLVVEPAGDGVPLESLIPPDAAAGITAVIFAAGLDLEHPDGEPGDVLVARQTACLRQVQAGLRWALAQPQAPALWVLFDAEPGQRGVAQAALVGFTRTLALEHPESFGGCLGLTERGDDVLDACAEELRAPGRERWSVLGPGRRLVPRLTRVRRAGATTPPPRLDGAWLISGGFGDLGLRVGRWLVARGARRLLCVSRSGPRSEAAQAFVAQAAAEGVELSSLEVDLAAPDAVARVRAAVADAALALRGLVHCAGVVHDGLLVRQSDEQIAAVLRAKVASAVNLLQALDDQPLEHCVLFGSVASVFGSPGQANYAAANACLEALAVKRRAAGRAAQCLSWGPWQGDGMMGRLDASLQARVTALGLQAIEPAAGLACLEEALATDQPHLVLVPIDWERAAVSLGGDSLGPLLEELSGEAGRATPQVPAEPEPPPAALAAELRRLAPRERRARLTRLLQDNIGVVLRYPAGVLPDVTQGFFSMGLDSLMLVDLLRRTQALIGVPLAPSVGFEHPTVNDMAAYLSELLGPADAPVTSAPEPAGGGGARRALDELSEAEAEALLEQRIAELSGEPAR